ncbi:tRNA threonylcarbamoyladenosine biosynthesis protein TsaE [Mesoflavibacter sabulilitoris]|uniref:tRNA threonylcarbamoyladenosine biosynthesis protein TsaE n=1 Tax=Mesoflavibacter zeaxanthinifaciens subsp. sabulilitoris TaxID=1520893 RepID=A0A2T1NGW2_9FLAO|nr:tRNA (adenosine(37)-N6)-threonylcarbamoyltransferase complex ATPase subunit type 1 TsaE [Mesoflavibacter zeaxanthinifaciens]MBB3122914.1 tRNA threonylcarbamoyladenosine biosynthesis protein TsaE [Mesoflavibacter zeaxanthinifaciens subsp. sabulilitoris]PSG92012.1 tRNA (adenosine(37)-N6)-threonylcarbamoyltransferase complex ATPase subunit type 1 TsaE [Mesoflavibacter zeaxanthinifaciens subsp. sabulilitoris]
MNFTYTLDQLEEASNFVLKNAKSKIILFDGEMGSGKTTLIKKLVKQLGSQDTVSSPTFSLVNEYETNDNIIYHFDLYRVNEEEELYNFGIETYIYSDKYVFVEWPDLLKTMLQEEYTVLSFITTNNSSRQIKLTNTK